MQVQRARWAALPGALASFSPSSRLRPRHSESASPKSAAGLTTSPSEIRLQFLYAVLVAAAVLSGSPFAGTG